MSSHLPVERSAGSAELVHAFPDQMPTGVTVTDDGRIFVCYPRWGDPVEFTVAELRDGEEVAYPDAEFNSFDDQRPADCLVSVQSVVVDPAGRLWLLDTGSTEFGPVIPGGPKLVGVDLESDEVVQTIRFPADVALETTYLNDIRFDLRRGEGGAAFITDSSLTGPSGIIVVDLASGRSWRKLHDHPSTRAVDGFVAIIEGRPLAGISVSADGIAISADGERLYYCPLSSRRLYSASVEALYDEQASDDAVAATVEDHGEKGASDGLGPTPTGASTHPTTSRGRSSSARLRAHSNRSAKPRAPTATVLSPRSSPVPAATAAIVCERLCVSAPSTIIIDVVLLIVLFEADTRRTRPARGAATLLICAESRRQAPVHALSG